MRARALSRYARQRTEAHARACSTATIRAGIFKIRQARARAKGATLPADLLMEHPANAKVGCGRPTKRAVRRLTVVAKGLFRTFGGASTATARNATFTTTDRCDGTQTRVLPGRVKLKLKRRRFEPWRATPAGRTSARARTVRRIQTPLGTLTLARAAG